MPDSNQDRQDRRSDSAMEDSTGMTIEFLRARLLSERSVSKSARQRAEELEKLVEELEEELKIVSLQRKMAEKATSDVLAILENQGVSDISEEFDSSSDRESHQESKVGSNMRTEENFLVSKLRRNEQEELSGSDHDSSSVPGRSLSWKGRIDSPRSREKYKNPSLRRRSTFSAMGSSSPRQNLGKSCRQIKHRETRSVVQRSKVEPVEFDCSQENGVAASSEAHPNSSYGDPERFRESSEKQKEKVLLNESLPGSNEKKKNGDPDFTGHGKNKDMEKALEHQARLIGQNEEMEKAQREWEEKFRENNTSTPDSCDHGNHSDITEERYEMKGLSPSEIAVSQSQEAKQEARDGCLFEEMKPNGFLLPSDVEIGGRQDQLNGSTVASSSQVQDFAFPTAYGRQSQQSYAHHPSQGSHRGPLLHGSSHASSVASSSDAGNNFRKGNSSGTRSDLYALVPRESQDQLGGVLDALKQAKVSLEQKMTRLPVVDCTIVRDSVEPSVPAISSRNRLDIPVGCAGLFRLPTDFAIEEAAAKNSYCLGLSDQFVTSSYVETRPSFSTNAGDRYVSSPFSDSRPSFSPNIAGQFVTNPSLETRPPFSYSIGDQSVRSHYVETRPTVSTNASDRFITSPYLENRSTVSSNYADRFVTDHKMEIRPNFPVNAADQFVTSASDETRSNFSAHNRFLGGRYAESWSSSATPIPHVDPYLSQPSSRYTNPSYLNYQPFPDQTRWTSNEVLTRPFPHRSAGGPAGQFSLYDDHIRPNMYR